MNSENINRKKVEIDLDYIMPDTSFIYPLYSSEGEKLLNEREVLTQGKIKTIREKYGNKVYYAPTEKDTGIIPSYVYDKALNQTKNVLNDIIITNKFTRDSYKKSEQVIDEILSELNSRELTAINLLKNMKSYDEYLYYHSINVGLLSALMVKKRRTYKGNEIKSVVLGAYLSDLGKIKLDKTILYKPDRLNEDEQIEMKLHPQEGYNIIKSLEGIDPIVLQTILFHHERFDDEGYYSLPYETLPTSPKIVAICDMYDALTTPKPYRQAYSPSEALKLIVNSVDKQFDRELVGDFVNLMGSLLNNSQAFYRKGDFCILNTGEICLVSEVNARDMLKPRMMVFAKFEESGNKTSLRFYQHPIEVDLTKDMNRKLSTIIMHQKLIDAIRNKLKEKRMLVDYLYMTIPDWH
ncbi:MAG TPA: HD domain-containing protein [Spirochaetota bacterium]|nr:HD domain-containing protein [Spirochaetota bacterium]HPF05445.1 HD domain-containing protein [Spirochaetota bacterium]HPJ41586.1 HD domain-containing protein [Spirochaetota bacterium]HPR36855.1 HD domain-containing protein [Spirochaetota bacterium]HRX48097.1 HD domain-containing protein [Spirochaetota bacterium]